MSYEKHDPSRAESPTTASRKSPASPQPADRGVGDAAVDRALRQMAAGQYEKALDLLLAAGKNPRILNARGVCLLRLGRFEAAMRALRELVLNPGSTWMRSDLQTVYKTNYATALLLGGHPSGCLDVLREINDEANPTVQRLHAAIERWAASLPFWRRLNWRFGRIEPNNCTVPIDFTPGELDDQPATRQDSLSAGLLDTNLT
jgi:tetratricopeptide (TPR) repeat protein